MIVTMAGIKPRHAGRIQTLAFLHGKSGVGHIYYDPARVFENGNTRVWRLPSSDDPGQPQGWDHLVPFALGGLADHIRWLCSSLAKADDRRAFVQALVFQSAAEGQAFQAAFSEAEGVVVIHDGSAAPRI